MKVNRLGIVLGILVLSLSLASAVSLSDYVVSPSDPLVNQMLSINATFSGGFEAERWVNWTKQGIAQGWLIPPLISKWDFKEPWFNSSEVFDVARLGNNNGTLVNFPIPLLVYTMNVSVTNQTETGDVSGEENNGSLVGYVFNDGAITGASWGSGKYGGGMEFNGTNEQITLDTIENKGEISVLLWVKINSLNAWDAIIGTYVDADKRFLLRINDAEKAQFYIRNHTQGITYDILSNSALSIDTWIHLAGIIDNAGIMKMYINSEVQIDTSTTANNIYSIKYIGSHGNGNYFNGSLDAIRIWNRSLNQNEIEEEMNSSRPVNGHELIGSWEFEEGEGAVAYDTNQLIKGITDTGIRFDGVGDYITLSSSIIDTDMAVSAWINLDEFGGFITGFSSDNDPYILVHENNVSVQSATAGTVQEFVVPTITLKEWNNIIIASSGGTTRVYFNGVESSSGGQLITGDLKIDQLGRYASTATYLNGSLDEVYIYNNALSSREAGLIYEAQAPLFQPWYNSSDESIWFDGVDDYILIDDQPAQGWGKTICNNGCTFSAWINPVNDTSTKGIIGRYDTTGDNRFVWFFVESDNTLRAQVCHDGTSNCSSVDDNTDVADGSWHNVLLTYDGTNSTLGNTHIYIDGNYRVSGDKNISIDSIAWADDEDLFIGVNDDGSLSSKFNGSIKDIRIWNQSLTENQVGMVYKNQWNLSEDNFMINDSLVFYLSTYNGTDASVTYSVNVSWPVNVSQFYESFILEGSSTNYYFSVLKDDNIANLSGDLVYNASVWTPTNEDNTSNFLFSYNKLWPVVGFMNNSFYWDYNITGIDGESLVSSLNGSQLIYSMVLGACTDSSNQSTLLFNVLHEDTLGAIEGANIWGTITYWNPDNPTAERNYSFGSINSTPGYIVSSSSDTYNFPSTSATLGDYETNFNVKSPSILTSYYGKGNVQDCAGVTVALYEGSCSSGSLLISDVATATHPAVFYDWFISWDMDNYTSPLTPGVDYCIKFTQGGCNVWHHSGETYSGNILTVNTQQVGHDGSMKLQNVVEDATRVCIAPTWGNFTIDAYLHHQGGDDGYIQRWYLEDEQATNESQSFFMYNFDRTNTTKTLTMSLYQNEFGLYPGVLSQLLRFYPGENLWRVVQMEKTDTLGQANWHIREEDTDYKLKFYYDSEILKETDLLYFDCPDLYEACTLRVSLLRDQITYATPFDDIAYWTYPSMNSLTSLENETLSIHVISPSEKLEWFAIWLTYNGTDYKTNLTNSSGGWANITLELLNVTEPEQLIVYYGLAHETKGAYRTYRTFYIYPHASNPSFYKSMVYLTGKYSSFWLMFLASIMLIALVGSFVQFGITSFSSLASIIVCIMGVFTYFGWFPSGILILLAVPTLYMALFGIGGRS